MPPWRAGNVASRQRWALRTATARRGWSIRLTPLQSDDGAIAAKAEVAAGPQTLPDGSLHRVRRWPYYFTMNIETLVALPEDLKAKLDRRAPSPPERNELVAAALRAYFAWPRPGEDASDLAIINAHAAELNAEAQDALSYQIPL